MTLDEFLLGPTPNAWCEQAAHQLDILLIDHAHCEKKAASTALNLMYRYPEQSDVIFRLSRFAREELRHFEQVMKIMHSRGIALKHLSPARYAGQLHQAISKQEPLRLIDTLLVSALIEARSCERFRAVIPYLDDELAKFYRGLLSSEERHFTTYLAMAKNLAKQSETNIEGRIDVLASLENELIQTPDEQFRFHSGEPVTHPVSA